MKTMVRILEVTRCRECPHLDDRWERAPWYCTEGGLEIRSKDRIHCDCPLDTKKEYLDANDSGQPRLAETKKEI